MEGLKTETIIFMVFSMEGGGDYLQKKINSTTIKGSSKPDLIGLKHKQIKRLH